MNNREVMQQALEALELGYDAAKAEADQYHAAMAGYRPERHARMDAEVQQIAAAITALKAALAEPQDKPVAWRYRPFPSWPWSLTDDGYYAGCKRDSGYAVETLYTHPAPQRQPLTEEAIKSCERHMKVFGATPFEQLVYFARAIERAHGITGETK